MINKNYGNYSKQLQLISAPLDKGRTALYENGIFAPLGLIWLANYLQCHGFDVEIMDGQNLTAEDIISRLYSPFVGISFNIFSTNSLDRIAQAAKKNGSIVIVGGQAATPLARELLMNNPDIDYVIRFSGEEGLKGLLSGNDMPSIPGLVYRADNGILTNRASELHLRELPPIRWAVEGLDIPKYWENFSNLKATIQTNHFHNKPLSSFAHRGCPMRTSGNGCSFCSRVDAQLQSRPASQMYEEYSYLVSLGADRIEDFSDSWLFNGSWLKELAMEVHDKGHWGAPLRIYADTRHVNENTVTLMKQLGVDSVILGIESGDEHVLRQNNKPTKINDVLRAVDSLAKNDLRICPSFVLGLIGESVISAERTFALAREISRRSQLEMSYFSLMTPFPGSKAWDMLMQNPGMRKKYGSTYKLDAMELQRDFIGKFTDLGKKGIGYLTERISQEIADTNNATRDY